MPVGITFQHDFPLRKLSAQIIRLVPFQLAFPNIDFSNFWFKTVFPDFVQLYEIIIHSNSFLFSEK